MKQETRKMPVWGVADDDKKEFLTKLCEEEKVNSEEFDKRLSDTTPKDEDLRCSAITDLKMIPVSEIRVGDTIYTEVGEAKIVSAVIPSIIRNYVELEWKGGFSAISKTALVGVLRDQT